MMTHYSKSIRCDLVSNSFRKLVDESRKGSSIFSPSILGFAGYPLPSTSNCRISSKSIKPSYVAIDKRYFSAKAMPESKSTSKSGKGNRKPFYFVKHKDRKRVKALTQESIEGDPKNAFPINVVGKSIPDCRVSARKKVNNVNSAEVLHENLADPPSVPDSVDGKIESKTEAKQKPRSRNKKKKEEPSDALLSSGADPSKGSKSVKKPNGQSPQTAKVSIFCPPDRDN